MRPELEQRLAQVGELIPEALGDTPPIGFALGIVHDGELVYTWCDGYANSQQQSPVTPDTVFRVGSISKTFTAVAVLQLWERGCFALDDPVNDYLKAFGIHPPTPDSPAITIHHLLSHTSGLGRGETLRELIDVYGHFTGWWDSRFATLNDFYGAEGLHPAIPAGQKYSYANNGYAVLGQLVEDVSGQSFTDYMRQHIFDPLGMTHSDVILSERTNPTLAMGYTGKGKSIRPTEIRQQGAGSILCSLNDLAAFLSAMIEQDKRILHPNSWQTMLQAHWQLHPHLWTVACGMEFYLLEGHRLYNQSGGAGGFNANLVFSPDHRLGAVALSNRNLTVETVLATWQVMRHLLDVPSPISEAEQEAKGRHATRSHWQELTGYYAPSPGWKTNVDFYTDVGLGGLHIEKQGDHLMMRAEFGHLAGGKRLYPDADDPLLFHVKFNHWNALIFQRDSSGQVDSLVFGHFHLLRTPVEHSLKSRLKRLLWVGVGVMLVRILFFRRLLPSRDWT